MNIRQALDTMSPSLALHRAARDEIARQDARISSLAGCAAELTKAGDDMLAEFLSTNSELNEVKAKLNAAHSVLLKLASEFPDPVTAHSDIVTLLVQHGVTLPTYDSEVEDGRDAVTFHPNPVLSEAAT